MGRKPVVPAALAESLTADKPPSASARAVSVLSGELPADLAAKSVDDLACEIIALQIQGTRVLLAVGRRLLAAKEKLSHGEWLPFLEGVNIPERLAQRYMKLAREWSSNPTILSDLGMSKALALLALPAPQRDEFIAEGHVVNGEEKSVTEMSAKELADAIKARKDAEAQLETVRQQLADAERDAEQNRGELVRANQRLELAQTETAKAVAERDEERDKRIKATDELFRLKNQPIEVAVEKVVDADAIEAAKQEVRDALSSEFEAAKKAKENEQSALARLKHAESDAKLAQAAMETAQSDANAAREELERVKAENETLRKSAPLADSDLSLFLVLFEQVQASVNKMHGILQNQPPEKQESLKKALSTLADTVRKKAE